MRDDEPPGPAVRAVSDIPERAGAPHPVAAVYLEVGTRDPARDVVHYPDDDLRVDRDETGARVFRRGDGTVLGPA